ncbi:hypothetical protein [Arcticibacterium luteifluviistationis]|uniref:Glyoxalase-like domain-containing protein n=1 Tax=Arcticibacterium luteifluviistationis TaxID=1784714 RepID=A0A2Z4G7I4_9BACT|nr:hypothetical protein [Arcticibacterium luteifluviistationis]AWV97018.1 hypothetical protein DJ013_02030 [Arcticibacterium luteifluviistationis]
MKTLLQTPTGNKLLSHEFYSKLDFKAIPCDDYDLLTDGKTIIEINPDNFARAGLKLFKPNWSKEVKLLKNEFKVHELEDGYMLASPSGMWVYLIEKRIEQPEINHFTPSLLGNNAGLSLESPDMLRSETLFKIIGFQKTEGEENQSWISLKNENSFNISIMKPFSCPHLFFNPSLTFFNGIRNAEIISKIRRLHIPITQEVTAFNASGKVENIIIRDPGGLAFFIYND